MSLEELNQMKARLAKTFELWSTNRAIDENWLYALVITYVILIIVGAFGNGLVCIAVARKPAMRTERNMFILNLAISDLFFCFFTIPFSLIEISVKFWP